MGGVASIPTDPSRKVQVISAGWSRTGTVSMSLALDKLLDGPICHGGTQILVRDDDYCSTWIKAYAAREAGDKEGTLKLVRKATQGFVGTADLPPADFIPEMLELYPEAKVVLVRRDAAKWWNSIATLTSRTTPIWLGPVLSPIPGWRHLATFASVYSRSTLRLAGLNDKDASPADLIRHGGPHILEAHHNKVRSLVPKERLLEMDLKDGWEPLCKFLDLPVPDESFPRANDGQAADQFATRVLLKVLQVTRLLRLCPSTDPEEPLQGELIEYYLADIDEPAHPYEALSYVWGKPDKTRSISIEGSDVPITSNLHVALKALRHQSFERFLWADALCINQTDDVEKDEQICLMYMIYARASLVIVWLGHEEHESTQAIEDLRRIGSMERSQTSLTPNDSKATFDRIVKLFKRNWFTRIWVLQEIGAARSVQIRCGHSAINGYAFGLAVDLMESAFSARHDLRSLHRTIRSVAYLMQGSRFRSAFSHGVGSEGVCPFGELVDMFHSRKATRSHDKIYALLNMSSDDTDISGLLPDYTIPFGELLKRATAFILSENLNIECRGEVEAVVIKTKGYVLGYIEAADEDMHANNRQCIDVNWRDTFDSEMLRRQNIVAWMIQISTIPLRKGDIICVIEGATRPTIIRTYRDFSAILVAAAPPPKFMDDQSVQLTWDSVSKQIAAPFRDLVLVWDWKCSARTFSKLECYSAWANASKWSSKNSKSDDGTYITGADEVLDCGLLLLDAGNLEIAERGCTEALQVYELALQSKASGETSQRELSDLLHRIRDKLYTISHSVFTQHVGNQREPGVQCISWLFLWALQRNLKFVMKLLSETGRVDPNVADHMRSSMLSLAARMGRSDVVDWLLSRDAHVNILSFERSREMIALHEATEAGHLAIVERLLEANADVNATTKFRRETALQKAAGAGNLAIVDRLIQGKAWIDAANGWGCTALQKAAEAGHIAVVEQLLQAKADVNKGGKFGESRPLQAASGAGHLAIVQLLLKAKANVDGGGYSRERPLIQTASSNGHLAIVERLLQAGANVDMGKNSEAETALAAASKSGHLAVVERLLKAKADVNADAGLGRDGRTALQAASEAGHFAVVQRFASCKSMCNCKNQ
ncbi:hypothetical protein G7054_g4141 [Neopestalotiopsis clavispora]|nr:hypothetical protein G7054_g4141 [Neopestalotiopsis clavispora]